CWRNCFGYCVRQLHKYKIHPSVAISAASVVRPSGTVTSFKMVCSDIDESVDVKLSAVRSHVTNMKGIQRHGSKFRVQKRVSGKLRKTKFHIL
ncbi:MAG: hypothetical protein P8M25_03050, partial [Paracoccaceae bacterium]|nr:hypothetical protein [Paracoccaceae bacterium]